MNTLQSVCLAKIKDLRKLGVFTKTYGNSGYTFIDNGANILAVAHIDTVARGKPNFLSVAGTHVSIALDDRLGVHMLLNVLPLLGLKYDILLTEDEEIGFSTAYDFKTEKQYNWIFSMDRRGVGECALYQYYNNQNCDAVISAGFKPVMGSFSDIAFMDAFGVSGFNFSAGYYGEHMPTCKTSDVDIWAASQMVADFYNLYFDVKLPYYVPVKKAKKSSTKKYTPAYSRKTDAAIDAEFQEWSMAFENNGGISLQDLDDDRYDDTDFSNRFQYHDFHQCDFCGNNDGLDYGITYYLCPQCYNNVWRG